MTLTTPSPRRPERSAHATIRGYLYQTCLGVLRWVDLKPGEVLVCEGDEDLDRHILGGGSIFEQVKAYSGGLGIADKAVIESLRQFLRSYTTLHPEGRVRRFLFTTTAYRRRSRKGGLDFDLLEAWQEGDRSPEVCAAVRSIVLGDDPPEWLAEAVAWLDAEPEGWKGFLDAVKWTFEAPDLDKVRSEILGRLAASPTTRSLPAETLLDRLVTEVLEASSRPAVRDRLLTRDDLSRLADTARAELGDWERSEPAGRLRKVFDELAQIGPLLLDNTAELPPNPSPGKLLTAAYEVIPFEEAGRREELDTLATWCNGQEPKSVLLLTGEGGSGKTRLAIEWCRRLRHQGWHAGFLRRDRGKDDLDPLLAGVAPRLVVVDYAETRLAVVEPLLYKMGVESEGASPKVRLLLLARRAGDWWEALSRGTTDRAVEDLLARSLQPRTIAPLVPSVEERRQAFRAAVEAFAFEIGKGLPWDLPLPNLEKEDFKRALYLHMAALAALDGRTLQSAGEALDETLRHERRFWRNQVGELGLDAPLAQRIEDWLDRAVAAMTLIGGAADKPQAQATLGRILDSSPARPELLDAVLTCLRRLYGIEEENGRFLEPLQPDVLGEQHVADCLERDARLLARLLEGATPAEGYGVLTVLTRLAQRRPEAGEWLKIAFEGRLEKLGEIALDVAVETGDPIGMVLAREVEEHGTRELAQRLAERCDEARYRFSLPLRETALAATQKTLSFLEPHPKPRRGCLASLWPAESILAGRARLASNLGVRLSHIGRREDALQATQKAVELHRRLAARRPDAFLPDLAIGLNNLGNILGELGRREAALQATQEAAQIYRQLAAQWPNPFLPYLATSLNNLGNSLSNLGRREHAFRATQEALQIYRRLAAQRPDEFLPYLAASLNNLGSDLSDFGRREQALQATQEAVELGRQLAARRPDVFLPNLATSLNNLGNRLSDLGRCEQALQATQEAVELGRQLAARRPDAFLPDLAMSLSNLGNRLSDFGRREDALQAAQEAADLRRQLAARRPDAFLPELAQSLTSLSPIFRDLGRHEEALRAADEAIRILTPFFLRYSDAFRLGMTVCYRNYLQAAEAAGQEPDEQLLQPIAEVFAAWNATDPGPRQ